MLSVINRMSLDARSKSHNMKSLPYLISSVILIITLSSCRDTSLENRVSELEDQAYELESKISGIEYEFDDVLSAMRSLESEIDDFDYEDWKVNVPEVVDEFDDLKRAVSDVEYEF